MKANKVSYFSGSGDGSGFGCGSGDGMALAMALALAVALAMALVMAQLGSGMAIEDINMFNGEKVIMIDGIPYNNKKDRNEAPRIIITEPLP